MHRTTRRVGAVVTTIAIAASVLPLLLAADETPAHAAGGCASAQADTYGQAVCGDLPSAFWRLHETAPGTTTAQGSSRSAYARDDPS